MDIVIIANFCAALDGGANSRFTYLASMLCHENQVELVSSDFSHGRKKARVCNTSRFPFRVTLLHEPGYPTNVCLSRFKSHMAWGKEVRRYLATRQKPDVVYCAVPSLSAAFEAAYYCQKNGIKFVIDVQDLWPEAFQMVIAIPFVSKVIFSPFQWYANKIYSSADEIIAVSQTYVDRAISVNRKVTTGYSIFLGTELKTFDQNVEQNPVKREDSDDIWLGYCGTLGSSYDIRCVIDALDILKNSKIKFVVMGDGPRKEEFEAYAKEKGVNAEFTGRLPYPVMCGKLAACDIVVNPITRGAAQSIINKHADYAASGLPVLNTQECPEYRNLIDNYNMGFNCKNNDAEDLARQMQILVKNKALRQKMGLNARKCAEERFDRKNSYQEILDIVG